MIDRRESNKESFTWVSKGLPLILLVCSIALNLGLAKRARSLEEVIVSLKSEGSLQAGAKVPPLAGRLLTGERVSIAYNADEKPMMIYIFSPLCGWCKKNTNSVRSLIEQISSKHRVIGISMVSEGLSQSVTESGFKFPVLHELPPSIVSAYKLGGTPQTIIVSSDGKILQNWIGAYGGSIREEIEKYFGVKLPEA